MLNSRKRTELGFTLTEALIAVAVLAVLAAAIAPAVAGAVRAATRITKTASQAESLRTTDEVLRRLTLGIVWPSPLTSKDMPEGDENRVRFLTVATADGSPAVAGLGLGDPLHPGRLLVSLQSTAHATPKAETFVETGLREVKFRYYGRETRDAPLGWRSAWHASRPPLMIGLQGRLQTAEGTEREISIDALVGGQAPIACEYDPVKGTCRGEK
jgi:prepilin-type N-terminal cleavage/methylation domain-containing protein